MTKINVSNFKARCLTIRGKVREAWQRVVNLKGRQPIAELPNVTSNAEEYPQLKLEGTVLIVGDVVGPAFPDDHWDVLRD